MTSAATLMVGGGIAWLGMRRSLEFGVATRMVSAAAFRDGPFSATDADIAVRAIIQDVGLYRLMQIAIFHDSSLVVDASASPPDSIL